MTISLNWAIPSITGLVIGSKIEKMKDWLPNEAEVAATGPGWRVNVDGLGLIFDVLTKKLTDALDAVLDLGKYPIFLAKLTTFSLNVALSMNT